MFYEIYIKKNYQVIKINDVLSLGSDITELDNIVNDFLKKNIVNVAIHFKDGSYLYSGSAAVIIRCWEYIKEKNGNFVLINVNEEIVDFLAIMGLDSVIKTCNSDEELEDIDIFYI